MPKTAATTEPERLGQLVRRHRKELGLRQVDLAEIIGEDQRYITAVETGKVTPPIYRLAPFIKALDIPADAVFQTAEATDPPSARSSWNIQTLSDLLLRRGVNDLTPVAA